MSTLKSRLFIVCIHNYDGFILICYYLSIAFISDCCVFILDHRVGIILLLPSYCFVPALITVETTNAGMAGRTI